MLFTRKTLLMIIFLLLTYYIYFEYFNYYIEAYYIRVTNNTKLLGLNGLYFTKGLSSITYLFFGVKSLLIDFKKNKNKLVLYNDNQYCKYLKVLLRPWDLPNNCITDKNDNLSYTNLEQNDSNFINHYSYSSFVDNDLNYNKMKEIQKQRFQNNINLIKKLRSNFRMIKIGEIDNDHGEYNISNKWNKNDNIYNRLANVSLNVKYNNKKCDENIDFNKLWNFGRVLCKINKEISSNCDNSEYYFEFLALVYYNCIFNSNKENKVKNSLMNNVNINKQLLLEIVSCYQSIPIFKIDDNELLSLSKLCEWEYNKHKISIEPKFDVNEMKLITKFIKNMNYIFLNIDLIDMKIKYDYEIISEIGNDNLSKNDKNVKINTKKDNGNNDGNKKSTNNSNNDDINSKIFQTEYFSKLIKLVKIIYNQILIQYDHISEEVNGFIESTNKTGYNSDKSLINKGKYDKINISINDNESSGIKFSDSFNWKQVVDSIFYNSQNILIREHINSMLINIVFDTIVQVFNPWISLFYQASFIINSYLSIILFLLVIAAILVCFNTIPCFRSDRNSKKTDVLWKKILRIYKANVMVVLLNLIFILGGLLRYLYLPNEIELSNSNISIIKAMNKVLNIILCPFIINIITSFSTIFSIFQWQLIWLTNKLSFSSILNL
ncbi:hypothetical protein FG386_001532 [Cryptosporidium ryanae]|uniref:uncharacterized protein n=1 Tax=Cryptosporidium ryanae TaxID=515981 RepID=UPI003519DD5D|nr:hypothetical protein FG386_001532 [Cryptosporidium ryanae]